MNNSLRKLSWMVGLGLVGLSLAGAALAAPEAATVAVPIGPTAPPPGTVTIAGELQSEVGCGSDWNPSCATTHLTYNSTDQVWQGTWALPAGSYDYKAAINDSWDENYGQGGVFNGPQLTLSLGAPASVKFYYDHVTHWVTDNHTSVIATVPGDFQSEIGCGGDWDPGCLRAWLKDLDGDGIYTLTTTSIPAGAYQAKVAIDESWDESYGQGGVLDGDELDFTVPANGAPVRFSYNAATHVLRIVTVTVYLPLVRQ